MKEKSIFIKCVCSCSAIQVERSDEDEWYVSLWSHGFERKIWGFWHRLAWCWNIMRTGMPWADCVILSDEGAARLADFIYDNTVVDTPEK